MKTVEQMEMEDLRGELNELKLGLGGIGTKDVMRMHDIEDEIDWRQESGFADLTAQEIQDELIEKDVITETYIQEEVI